MAMPGAEPSVSPTACEIRAALEQVAASNTFNKSGQLVSFLRFVVRETLAGRGDRIKAYTIATAALGRDEHFDPQVDPIVRVEAGRLRRALRQYYAAEGCVDPVVIDLPVGRYAPVFRRGAQPRPADAPRYGAWRKLGGTIREYRTLLLLIVIIAAAVSLSLDMVEMLFTKTIWPAILELAHATSAHLPPASTDGLGH
jgi:hypothetical protein